MASENAGTSPILGRGLHAAATGQADWWWRGVFRPRIAGMSDEEYHWEPAPGTWTIQADANGNFTAAWPPSSDDPPVTTIAWRLAHIFDGDGRHFDGTSRGGASFPAQVAEATVRVDQFWEDWRRSVDWLGDDGLATPLGDLSPGADIMRLGRNDPIVNRVLHQLREFIHHGAEVGLLRDLFWATHRNDPVVRALFANETFAVESLVKRDRDLLARTKARFPDLIARLASTGTTDAVALLAASGFDVNAPSRRSALHAAAAAGDVAMAKLLVQLGADTSAIDIRYGETPLFHAQFFKRFEVAEFLSSVGG